MLKFLNKIDRFTHRTLEAMCSLFLAAMVGFTIYNVTMRYVFNNPPVWGDLLTVLSNIWLMFIALSLTAQEDIVDNGSSKDYNDKEENVKKSFEGFKF